MKPLQKAKEPLKKPLPSDAAADELANDYQLSRALEMLKGLDVFGAMAKGKAAALPTAAPAAKAAK